MKFFAIFLIILVTFFNVCQAQYDGIKGGIKGPGGREQGSYGSPSQGGYGSPSQNSYGSPSQGSYGSSSQGSYGNPSRGKGYGQFSSGYGRGRGGYDDLGSGVKGHGK